MTEPLTNPLEITVHEALVSCGLKIIVDGTPGNHGATKHLDFFLPDKDVYVEVTAFHTPRKVEQMSRAENIILIQGKKAVELFSCLITRTSRPAGVETVTQIDALAALDALKNNAIIDSVDEKGRVKSVIHDVQLYHHLSAIISGLQLLINGASRPEQPEALMTEAQRDKFRETWGERYETGQPEGGDALEALKNLWAHCGIPTIEKFELYKILQAALRSQEIAGGGWLPIDEKAKAGQSIILLRETGEVYRCSWGRNRSGELCWCGLNSYCTDNGIAYMPFYPATPQPAASEDRNDE